MLQNKKVDKIIKRKWQDVKAIATYNNQFKIISSIEMDKVGKYKNIATSEGNGKPRLAIDLKQNKKRGLEVDIVFFGRRNEEIMKRKYKDWKTFGHIVLSVEQARRLGEKILQITGERKPYFICKNCDVIVWAKYEEEYEMIKDGLFICPFCDEPFIEEEGNGQ